MGGHAFLTYYPMGTVPQLFPSHVFQYNACMSGQPVITNCNGTAWNTLSLKILHKIMCYLKLSDVYHLSLTCKAWSSIMKDEDSDYWKQLADKMIGPVVLKSEILSQLTSFKTKVRAAFHTWNHNDCSKNIYIKSSGFTLHRNPVAQSTDAARGKIGFTNG